jgi:uncharacterized protein YyaL (SSP411 family)
MGANRLIHSTSPYLLQHAHNPVDWYPWGGEALEQARRADKPVFLSLGYAACHWCHVMERESFENTAIAEVLNQHFVCIKVDREERPDLDETYMMATQLMTGRGGWPNSVWLLPDGRPWYAGTYFPPEDQMGRIGFKSLLLKLAEIWHQRRSEVEEQARVMTDAIQQHAQGPVPGGGPLDAETLIGHVVAHLQDTYDARQGGFGEAPKFPPHASLALLLDLQQSRPDSTQHQMLHGTLLALQRGGIHDHVGGGFHRYATDAEWLVPHFEKMLYDNAQLAGLYTEAWRQSADPTYRQTAVDTLDWVQREMTGAAGGFHSSLDADSEGEEGRFYVWSHTEILQRLGPELGARFCTTYQIKPGGNFHEEASGRPTGMNIPHLVALPDRKDHDALASARLKLRMARDQRVWPGRDDKVIASWNGLMIRAFLAAGRAFQREDYTVAGQQAATFLREQLWDGQTLSRSWRNGACSGPGFLEDYAAVALAWLDLTEADPGTWSLPARAVVEQLRRRFREPGTGALSSAGPEHGPALARLHDVVDQAMPSATSLAITALHRGSIVLNEPAWLETAREAAAAALPRAARMPSACSSFLLALHRLPGPPPAPLAGPRETCEGGACECSP